MLRLYGFVISHYSEKARWALEHTGADHESVNLLPGPHLLTTRRLGRASTVPVLVHDGTVVQGSDRILDHLEEHVPGGLSSPDRQRGRELERLVDEGIGVSLRCLAYYAYLPRRDLLTPLWTQDGPAYGPALYALAYPALARKIAQMYRVNASAAEAARRTLRRTVERLDEELAAQPYLDGDRFGRVDLCTASLLGPLVRPPNHPCRWPVEPPELLREVENELRDSATFQHAVALYREHRGRPDRV
jgi:glutathione S-transferase